MEKDPELGGAVNKNFADEAGPTPVTDYTNIELGTETEQPTLPDYNQVQNDEPPTYQSLYDKIKDAKAESSGIVQFCGQFILIMLSTLFFTIIIALFMSIPITMIVIGSIYKDECPAEEYIPIYLIVGGTFTLIQNIIILAIRINNRRLLNDLTQDLEVPLSETQVCCALASTACYIVVGLFLFAWFIAGNVWIYGTDVVTDDVSAGNYCHKTLYNFAFWLTNVTYMLMLLSCCCKCCTRNAE